MINGLKLLSVRIATGFFILLGSATPQAEELSWLEFWSSYPPPCDTACFAVNRTGQNPTWYNTLGYWWAYPAARVHGRKSGGLLSESYWTNFTKSYDDSVTLGSIIRDQYRINTAYLNKEVRGGLGYISGSVKLEAGVAFFGNSSCRSSGYENSAQFHRETAYYFPNMPVKFLQNVQVTTTASDNSGTGSYPAEVYASADVYGFVRNYVTNELVSAGEPIYSGNALSIKGEALLEPGIYIAIMGGRAVASARCGGDRAEATVDIQVNNIIGDRLPLEITNFDTIHQYPTHKDSTPKLISGQSALVEVTVKAEEPAADETRETYVILESGEKFLGTSEAIKLSEIGEEKKVLILFSVPKEIDTIKATIDRNNLISEESDYKTKEMTIEVGEAKSLSVAATQLLGFCPSTPAGCTDEVSSERYNYLVGEGQGDYTHRVFPNTISIFPIIGEGLFPQSDWDVVDKDGNYTPVPSPEILDILDLNEYKRKNAPYATSIIAIVNESYFKHIGGDENFAGIALADKGGIISDLGVDSNVMAHELGHIFGADHNNDSVTGFDPRTTTLLGDGGLGDTYVSAPETLQYNITLPNVMSEVELSDPSWFGLKEYEAMWETLTGTPVDPPLIILSGLLGKTGNFIPVKTFSVPEGYLTPDSNSTLRFSLLDGNGLTLASTSVDPDYTMWVFPKEGIEPEPGVHGAIEMDYAPIVVALPAWPNAEQIVVSSQGNVLANVPVPVVPSEPTPLEVKIQELYVGILGRAADQPGLDYWWYEVSSRILTLENTRASFTHPDQAEYTEIYGGLDNSQLVTATYENFLERDPDLTGLAYWVAELDAGRVNPDQMINAVINAVRDPSVTGEEYARDLACLENKLEVALYFTEQTKDYPFDLAYRAMARTVVADVTDDPVSVVQAKAMIDEYVGN